MATITEGNVSVVVPEHISIPVEAGTLSKDQVRRLIKARRGVGLACGATAQAMRTYPDRLAVAGVSPDALDAAGRSAEDIDLVITNLEIVLTTLKQANLLLDAQAHELARRVLATVRATEKFDETVVDLVPQLIAYFANERPEEEPPGGTT